MKKTPKHESSTECDIVEFTDDEIITSQVNRRVLVAGAAAGILGVGSVFLIGGSGPASANGCNDRREDSGDSDGYNRNDCDYGPPWNKED